MFVKLNSGTWINPKMVVAVYVGHKTYPNHTEHFVMIDVAGNNGPIKDHPPSDTHLKKSDGAGRLKQAEEWAAELVEKFKCDD